MLQNSRPSVVITTKYCIPMYANVCTIHSKYERQPQIVSLDSFEPMACVCSGFTSQFSSQFNRNDRFSFFGVIKSRLFVNQSKIQIELTHQQHKLISMFSSIVWFELQVSAASWSDIDQSIQSSKHRLKFQMFNSISSGDFYFDFGFARFHRRFSYSFAFCLNFFLTFAWFLVESFYRKPSNTL